MKEKLYVIKYYDNVFIVKSSYLKEFLSDWSNDEILEAKIKEIDLSNDYYEMCNYDFKSLEDFINERN